MRLRALVLGLLLSAHPTPRPTAIVLGSVHINVNNQTDPDEYGAYDFGEETISIEDGQKLLDQQETLTHEVFHACMTVTRQHDMSDDLKLTSDEFIESVAPCFVRFLQTNPDATRWLLRTR